MNRNWLFVFLGGALEILWVSGLKHSSNAFELLMTVITITVSFFLLTIASRSLPVGTLYAVFAGIGTAGTVLVEMVVFGEPFSPVKILLIATLLGGVVGLKVLSSRENSSEFKKQEEVA
ncbi:DMT family transporter [Domibacillus aminovorans]|uniref:Multidrug resistance protein SMR n=1 Tax=Domibacillus aminovorans TaxID=29332 RepID=A0A177LAT7_9BACI|nr:multidrug efflux SMR transporter [Domibacillus aminovorans]OAH62516.1 multidrug resistance protein SMR [Domibacillus aminovorans]